MDLGVSLLIGVGFAITIPRVIGFYKSLAMKGKRAPALREGEVFADGRRIIYFYTPSCPGCRMQGPIMEGLAAKHEGLVARINALEDREAAQKYGVFGVPFTIYIEDGKIAKTGSGLQHEAKLSEWLLGSMKKAA